LPTLDNVLEQNLALRSRENGISFASFDPTDPVPPTMNDIVGNVVLVSGVDGIHVFDGVDNKLIGNSIAMSGDHDCDDDTVGSGTAGTANFWHHNQGTTREPPGLCKPDDDHHHGHGDDDDFDDDGHHNRHDDDDDNDYAKDDDDDDDNDGLADADDIDDDNDELPDAIDDIEDLSPDSLLWLAVPPAPGRVRATPH
jgi:hypothetical protein